jgi:3-dehydroquinate dehydratase/shikimate dehydrogenase
MICVPITAASTAEAIRDLAEAAALADLVELRLDFLHDRDLRALFAARPASPATGRPVPVIATCRPRSEGGRFDGPAEARLAVLREAAALSADYVDIEASVPAFPDPGRAKVILSHHDFARTPPEVELAALHRSMAARRPDVVKIVTMPKGTADVVALARLAAGAAVPTVVFGMGELGLPTRLLYRRFGIPWTYAALRPGAESAPGQIPVSVLRGRYRADRVGPRTRVFAVIGNPVDQSRSPVLFNHAFATLGLDAIHVPILLPAIEELPALAEVLGVEGLGVRIPHQAGVRKFLDETDPLSARIGAVNTVVIRDGRWHGSNTEIAGALEAIRLGAGPELRGKRAAVLGAGHASRAVVAGLAEAGVRIHLVTRTPSRAETLAREFNCRTAGTDELPALAPEILVNTTPVGAHPSADESPVPASAFRRGMTALDMVYTPAETRFLADARKAGATAVSGVEFFIRQAADQWRTWLGTNLPAQLLEDWRRLMTS